MTPEQQKGQHGSCATVKIVAGDHYVVINAADYNAQAQQLYHDSAEEPKAANDAGGPKAAKKPK